MKAEHRKELETNVLADRLGRVVTNIKQGPQRGTALYVVLGILVAALAFFAVRYYRVSSDENSQAWLAFEVLDVKALQDYPESKPAQALRFIFASETMWNNGIKKLGSPDQKGALDNLDQARKLYEELKTEVAGDPILEPEALYALAQIEESKAILDSAHLDRALSMYEDLAKEYPKSAYGQLAAKRVETLSDDQKRAEVARIYQDLQSPLRFDRKN